MPKIKTRETRKDINVLDKSAVARARMRDAYLHSKNATESASNDGHNTPEEYADERTQTFVEGTVRRASHTASEQSKRLIKNGRDTIKKRQDPSGVAEKTPESVYSPSPPTSSDSKAPFLKSEAPKIAKKRSSVTEKNTYAATNGTLEHSSVAQSSTFNIHSINNGGQRTNFGLPTSPDRRNGGREAFSPARRVVYEEPAKELQRPTATTNGGRLNAVTRFRSRNGSSSDLNTARGERKDVRIVGRSRSKAAIKSRGVPIKTPSVVGNAPKTIRKNTIAARNAAKKAAAGIQFVAKAIIDATKALLTTAKGAIIAFAGGGGVVLIVIIVICLIGMIVKSPFGIFFSGRTRDNGAVSASVAVAQVNYDFNARLEALQDGDYAAIDISGQMADWPEVLAIFAVKVAGNNDVDAMDVAVLDQKRVSKLKAVFWDMNEISSSVETIVYPDSDPNDDIDDSWSECILHITISSKTADEMRSDYHFSSHQNEMLDELLENREMLLELIGDLEYISVEAEDLLRRLPDDLSDERRAVIKVATSLVGKVAYFWGGKSLVIGWDDRWGTIQKVWATGSSTTGTYRPYGLDCSGFVDWTFYNASDGAYYPSRGAGTYGQHAYSTNISWEEAMTGDLVFTPEDSHVGIVGGRDENGNLLIIHCSGDGVAITGVGGFVSVSRPDCFAS